MPVCFFLAGGIIYLDIASPLLFILPRSTEMAWIAAFFI